MPKVSVIVPIYNSEKYIDRCVRSIVNQTFEDIEILLINDGSTDNSINRLYELQKMDSRIRVIDKENSGVSDTRNLGVAKAKGKYVQFIDSDDYIDSEMIKNTLEEIERENADIIVTGLFLDIESRGELSSTVQSFEDEICIDKKQIGEGVLKRLNGTYINSPINKLYKKSIIEQNNIIMDKNISLGEDLLFNIQYFSYCTKVIFKQKSYYHYFMQVSDNLTFKFRDNKLELMKKLYDECKSFLLKCELSSECLIELNNIFIKWMYSCYIDLNNKTCPFSKKEKIKYIKASVSKYQDIISNTKITSLVYKILKRILDFPYIVLIVSKIMFWIKTTYRNVIYRK